MNMQDVYSLHCNNCDNILSLRGQSASLISKKEIQLYSTDLPTLEIVEENESKKFEHCLQHFLQAMQTHCGVPCDFTLWSMFHRKQWRQERKCRKYWDQLPTVSRVSLKLIIPAQEIPDKLKCEICQQLIESATKFKCKHSFCYACAMRQFDIFRCCPIDQQPVNPDEITQNQELQYEINQIMIYCENGCCMEGNVYQINTEDNACKQLIKLGQREAHEMACIFNKKYEE